MHFDICRETLRFPRSEIFFVTKKLGHYLKDALTKCIDILHVALLYQGHFQNNFQFFPNFFSKCHKTTLSEYFHEIKSK